MPPPQQAPPPPPPPPQCAPPSYPMQCGAPPCPCVNPQQSYIPAYSPFARQGYFYGSNKGSKKLLRKSSVKKTD
uniref:Uncharacterized protein n=1 Tax=Panagrolaimus davidi TaxID=227884 RepID=A0A914P3X8_9BILA